MALVDTEKTVIKRRKLMRSLPETFIGLGNLGSSGIAEAADAIVAQRVADEILRQKYPELVKKKKKSSRKRGSYKVDTQPKK